MRFERPQNTHRTSRIASRTEHGSGAILQIGEFEPYEWEEGELEEGQPVSYKPGVGVIVEGGKRRDGR